MSWQLKHATHLRAVCQSFPLWKDKIYELSTCLLSENPTFIKRKTKTNAQIN